jgi:hypothetical protein
MNCGGELLGVVAEAELEGTEELPVGSIDEFLGHLAEGVVGRGPELLQEGADAGFAVIRGR